METTQITAQQVTDGIAALLLATRNNMVAAKASLPAELAAALPTPDDIAKACKGRHGVRTGKPTKENGAIRYAWRYVRFHSGADTTMPVTATFDSSDWLKEHGHDRCYSGPIASAVWRYLDEAAFAACILMGVNPTRGTARWGRALGMR